VATAVVAKLAPLIETVPEMTTVLLIETVPLTAGILLMETVPVPIVTVPLTTAETEAPC
jgi:hypothetical protein